MKEIWIVRRLWLVPIIILGFIYAVILGRSAFFGFATDDFFLVNLTYGEAIYHTLHGPHFRPLWFLRYPFLNSLFGQNAFVHHIVNLILHAANCVLAFLWLRTSLGAAKASFAVLVWTMLPQTAFPIVWISQRNDALMSFFLLLSLVVHGQRHRISAYLLYVLAFLSKVTCMFFPAVFMTTKGLCRTRGDFIAGLMLLILSVAIAAYSFQNMEASEHLAHLSPAMRAANHCKNLVLGWFTLIVPIPFFANTLLALAYFIFAAGTTWLLIKCPIKSSTTYQLLIFSIAMSLPLAITSEVRITYLQSLFLTGAIFSAVNSAMIAASRQAKAVLAMTAVAGLIYACPATFLITEKFNSNEYSVNQPSNQPYIMYYLVDFYGWFRDFQKEILKRK
ncbi:hypothetical protein [Rhizorhabdus sp. FW153]|uniref:hypothetical protein n=1 Tax=Rhizorhabdus sp. FW153 TaxID=3400216 RepID=UPI003CEDFF38